MSEVYTQKIMGQQAELRDVLTRRLEEVEAKLAIAEAWAELMNDRVRKLDQRLTALEPLEELVHKIELRTR